VRLNIDLGELADEPEELYALADLANLALGGHAGDEGVALGRVEQGARDADRPRAVAQVQDAVLALGLDVVRAKTGVTR